MAQKQGYAKVTFDGEERLLRFDFNAMADLEDHFDKGIAAIMDKNRIGFSTIRGLYWAGLKWKMPGLSLEKVGNMLTKKMDYEELSLAELMEPVKKAITAAGWIKQKKVEADNQEDSDENNEKN
jgi:hypothetical protein